jgi:hypothetical protein
VKNNELEIAMGVEKIHHGLKLFSLAQLIQSLDFKFGTVILSVEMTLLDKAH